MLRWPNLVWYIFPYLRDTHMATCMPLPQHVRSYCYELVVYLWYKHTIKFYQQTRVAGIHLCGSLSLIVQLWYQGNTCSENVVNVLLPFAYSWRFMMFNLIARWRVRLRANHISFKKYFVPQSSSCTSSHGMYIFLCGMKVPWTMKII